MRRNRTLISRLKVWLSFVASRALVIWWLIALIWIRRRNWIVRLIITLILLRLRIILLRDRLIYIARLPWIASLIRILIGWWRSSIWINHTWWRKSASCHSTFKLYGNEFSILLNIKLMISSCEKWNDDNKS